MIISKYMKKGLGTLFLLAIFLKEKVVFAQEGALANTSSSTIEITNPLGVDNLEDLIRSVAGNFVGIAAAVLTLMVLYGAFKYMTSGGSPDKIKSATQTIVWAAIGYGVILLAGGLATIIISILGGSPQDLDPGISTGADVSTLGGIQGIIITVSQWMFGILMAVGIVFAMYSAFLFLTSQGEPDKLDKARKTLIWTIVAIFIGFLAWGTVGLVENLLGASSSELTSEQIEQAEHDQCVDRCILDSGSEISAQSCIADC